MVHIIDLCGVASGRLKVTAASSSEDESWMFVWSSEPVWALWRREKSVAHAGNRVSIPRCCSP